ncbi:MAG TPA: arginase family protein [Vicinamibacteria bacterium]|nr:arginase family protein [Vicinamibacteria bacterium]
MFLGIADDTQSSFLRGAAAAPDAIRRAYDGRCFNATTESGIDLSARVVDDGNLRPGDSWPASAREYERRVKEILQSGDTPFIAGGDHAVSVPALRAFEELGRPIHVVQIDAHPDLYREFEGNPDSHACVAARLLEMEHIATVTQVGIRTMNPEQREQQEAFSERLIVHEARRLEGTLPRLDHIPAGAAVYLTVDMDGFDPAYAPGVSHPVPGGLSSRQVLDLIQSGHWTLVGMDVVEVNPSRDVHQRTAILAARLLHEGMGYAAR